MAGGRRRMGLWIDRRILEEAEMQALLAAAGIMRIDNGMALLRLVRQFIDQRAAQPAD